MCLWTQEKVSDSEHDCMGAGSLFFCCFFHVNCNQWPWGCRRHPSKWQPNQNTRPCKKAPVVAPLSIGLLLCLAICFMITAVCYNLCPEGIYLSGAECEEMSRCPECSHSWDTIFLWKWVVSLHKLFYGTMTHFANRPKVSFWLLAQQKELKFLKFAVVTQNVSFLRDESWYIMYYGPR